MTTPPIRHLSTFTAGERVEIAELRREGQLPANLAKKFNTTAPTIRKIYQMEIFA